MGSCAAGLVTPRFAAAQDSTAARTLPPITVTVARADEPLTRVPFAVQTVVVREAVRARAAWGLDDVLAGVPGVFVADRQNFSVDQRLAIRGFGARSAFAVRGVKLLVDGIPLTLPDGQGQLTTLELGSVDHVEVLRGSASALFGNAAGGVIAITTVEPGITTPQLDARLLAGAYDRDLERSWSKWQLEGRTRLGSGDASVRLSRLVFEGERDHAAADLRTAGARARLPLGAAWVLTLLADGGDTPRADNPGALTLAELERNPDSAAALNLLRRAGKDVRQFQGGAGLRGRVGGIDVSATTFGLTRDLENPLPQAFITLGRKAWGVRVQATRPQRLGARDLVLTSGVDLQWQRDDRIEYDYAVPNAALVAPDNTPGAVLRNQLERVAEVGPFVRATLGVLPTLSVSGAVRYDRVRFAVRDRQLLDGVDNSGERTFAAASGSAGVALAAPRGVTLYANVATSFETPTTTELNNQPPPGGGGFNPDVRPQRATTVEIGARRSSARLEWSAAAYVAAVRDELIAFEDTAVPGRRYFRNAASARHRGLELGLEARPLAGVDLSLAWTISDFTYTSHELAGRSLRGRAIPGIPRHAVRAALRAQPAWARGGWLQLETRHASGYFVDDTLDTRTDAWWDADVRFGWSGAIAGWPVAPFVAIDNVFDAHYVSSVVINAARGRYYEPAPGRNASVGCSIATSRRPGLPRPARRM